MMIFRDTCRTIDPNNAYDRAKYKNAVIDEVADTKREFTPDPVLGGWHDLNIRPVVQFRWTLNGWVKRLRMEPFCD